MAERIGLVLNIFDNETAEVMTEKQCACSGCQDTRNCTSCLSGSDKVVAVVQNDACALPGDVVEIEHKTNALMGGAGLFYILPVLGLIGGAFFGGAMAAGWGMDESAGALLAGTAGLVISLISICCRDTTPWMPSKGGSIIMKIILDITDFHGKLTHGSTKFLTICA